MENSPLKHMEISEDETYGTERTEEKTGKKQEEIYTENSSCILPKARKPILEKL